MAHSELESHHLDLDQDDPDERSSGDEENCLLDNQRQCEDGSCVPRTELCPEEELLSQETILVMIGIAMAVFLLLVFLYCIQQHRRSAESPQQQGGTAEEPNHPELLLIPPPNYEEAVDVSLYPPTPQAERMLLSPDDEPTTPPPNYDAALHILAQSEENLVSRDSNLDPEPDPANLRRAVSADFLGINRCRPMTFSSFGANSKTFSRTALVPPPPPPCRNRDSLA